MKPTTLKRLIICIGIGSYSILCTDVYASLIQTGVYLGFNAGETFNRAHLHARNQGFNNLLGMYYASKQFNSFYPGIEIGYTKYTGSKWIIGITGDYSYNVDSNTKITFECPFYKNIRDQFQVKNNMQGSLLTKLGYAPNMNLMPYLVTGLSFSHLSMVYSNEVNDFYSKNNTRIGWRVGAGFEWTFAPNWSIGAQYYHVDYQKLRMNLTSIYNLYDPLTRTGLNINANNIQLSIKRWF